MKILSTIIHGGIRVLYGSVFLVFCTYMFTSCVIDTVTSFGIRNSSNDTLYIELSESDSPGDLIYYWCENSIDSMPPTWPTDTTEIYINNKKVVLDKRFYALPDSTVIVCPCFFDTKDTCYIYAIKKVHPTFRVIRQSCSAYSLSLKYRSSLNPYALRFITFILLLIPSTLPVEIWQSYHASIPLL